MRPAQILLNSRGMQPNWLLPIVVAGLLAVSGIFAAPATGASTYQVGTFNMAGGHKEHGKKGHEAPDALATSISERRPAFVLLQEACADWTAQVINKLKAANGALPGYQAVFDEVAQSQNGPGAECKHKSAFGNAIIFQTGFGFDANTKKTHQLTCPTSSCGHASSEQREMLCLRAEAKKLVACSLHLSTSEKLQPGEAEQAARVLATEYAGYQQFAGGDFNGTPGSSPLHHFYHRDYGGKAQGVLKEVDSPCGNDIKRGKNCRAGGKTHNDGRKIDYIFITPAIRVAAARATSSKHSDHEPLWADVES